MAENIVSKTDTAAATAPAPAPVQPVKDSNLHEIAGGWIMERKGTDVPGFLKATYIVVAISAIIYSIWWANGDTGGDRGKLVQQFNSATQFSPGFMWFVTALVVIFAIILWKFAFTKVKD
jgi:hypothetical protein